MAVEFRHARRPPISAALLEAARVVGTMGVPIGFQLSGAPQRVLPENPRRLGAWFWGNAQGVSVAGQTTAPAAGALVSPKLALLPGAYDVLVTTLFVGGAPVAADAINWELLLGGLSGAGLGVQVGGGAFGSAASLNQPSSRIVRVIVPASANLAVAAIAAGTAGVVYQAELLATPLEPALIGLDKASLAIGNLDGQRGWPVGAFPMFLAGEQELWAIANSQTQPAELRVLEIFKEPRGRTEIAPDGGLPG